MTRKHNANDVARTESGTSRRGFLGCLSLSPGMAGLLGAGMIGALQAPSAFADLTPLNDSERRRRAFTIRRDQAIFQRDYPTTPSVSNGDEELYPKRIANFSKGLPHNDLGEVDLN